MYAAYTKYGMLKPVTFACRCAVWRILMQIYFFIPYSYLFVCAFLYMQTFVHSECRMLLSYLMITTFDAVASAELYFTA